jgi:alpha-glucosidase
MESRKSLRARHDAALPFTRMLAGPADYTPVHFGERRNDTTWAHQLASAVAFTSGLLTYAAHPKALLESPAVELIKSIPAEWDQTRVLPGSSIGEVAILARRRGGKWFLSVLNGDEPRKLRIPLSFLTSGSWSSLAARDPDRMETGEATSATVLDLDLPAGGGYLARFTPPRK